MKSIRQIVWTVAVVTMCVTLSAGSVVAQTGGDLTFEQDERLSRNPKLFKLYLGLQVQYPNASEALVLEAAEELLFAGSILEYKPELEATQGRGLLVDLNGPMNDVKDSVVGESGFNPLSTGLPTEVTDEGGFPPGFIIPSGNLSLEDLDLTSAFLTYVIPPSKDGDGDGFVVHVFDNGLMIALNGDGERRIGFLNLIVPWPWGTNEKALR